MTARYSKTEAGRAELRARALPLSRTARNLLFAIDGSRPAEEWMGMVQGATQADLDSLVSQGLVEAPGGGHAAGHAAAHHPPGHGAAHAPAKPPAAAGPAGPAGAPAKPASSSADVLIDAMNAMSYDVLYDLLTRQAKERLGLIAGYRFVLEVEKCADLAEMQALARRFVQLLNAEHGEAGLRHLRLALGIQG